MDTIETTEAPSGSDDVTSSQDTAAQVDTQPDETPQDVDGEQGAESKEQASLLAGKYTTPQELEKAYKELEGKLGGLGQKAAVADLIQEKYGVTPEALRDIVQQHEREKLQERVKEDPTGYALERVQQLENTIALQNEERELNDFLQKNPEYTPFKDKIFKLGLNLERDKSYQDIATEYFGQARAQGQKDAYKKIDTKMMTQPTGVSSVPKRQISEEDMKNMSVAELEALLPHADTSWRL